ncbi:MAG: protein kinase [Thermoanaerobaculia bacterium]
MSAEELPELFARVLELDPAGRTALLDEIASGDPARARELERLLASAEVASPLLDRAPWPLLAARSDGDALREGAPLPDQIGPYRIVRELGRGGMGRVFLAEEETADFRRTVALKVIDRPAPDAVRRFRDEVRILSSLEHPGIARFIQGGQAPDGTWFLALEHVEGEDLVKHARQRGLPIARKLELFLAVLEAVDFAHRRGVVHRDLKPGHLLVGHDGRPRLLDFGISKLLDPDTHESLAVTRTESRALTPAYASPEQIRGAPVTLASDIYSLGVVLYELLAGRRPFAETGESRAALERAVLGTDPEPPSHAARRAAAPSSPLHPSGGVHELGRDLDAICLKALRKEPETRYASAAELADDLRRYLEHRPVLARRGGWRYRAARFAGRHRGRLATYGALALALAAIAFAWRVNGRAEKRTSALVEPSAALATNSAEIPSDGTESVEELERRFAAAPSSLAAGADLAAALLHDERIKEAALVMARVRQLPGASEDPRLDQIEGRIANNLGEAQRALALFRRALDNAVSRGRGHLVPDIRVDLSRALSDLGQIGEAHAMLLQARDEAERTGDPATLALALNNLAVDELMQGNLAAGERLLEQALVPARALADLSRLGFVLDNLSGIAIERGRPDLAEARYREAIGVWEKSGSKQRAAIATGNLAAALADLGRSAEAAAERESALTALRAFDDLAAIAVVLASRGDAAIDAGDLAAAERDAEAIDAGTRSSGDRESLAYSEALRGRIAWLRGDLPAARRSLEQAERLHVADGDLDIAGEVAVRRAEEEHREGADATAERVLTDALARLEGAGEGTTAFVAETLRVRIAAEAGRLDEAQRRLLRLDPAYATSPSLTRRIAFLAARGTLAASLGRPEEARSDLRMAIQFAENGGRAVAALELRLDLAAIEHHAESSLTVAFAHEVESAALSLGLPQLAKRARRIGSLS